MTERVSTVSIAFMGVSLLVSVAIPLILFFYFRKKKRADILPFFIGCAVMVLFAFVLEGGLNFAVSRTALGDRLTRNVWALAIYGGLMAGLFEETGRFLAFRTVLKKYQYKDMNALMYGAGHGGIEALIDEKAKDAYAVSLVQHTPATMMEDVLLENQQVLRAPIVRNGRQATVGYAPDIWKTWE